jgi:hypothetical protein
MSLESQLSYWAPILVAIFGGGVGFVSGRALESRRHLSSQKAQAYADFLKAMAQSASHPKDAEILEAAIEGKLRICIYGSQNVIRSPAAFDRAGGVVTDVGGQAAIRELIKAMRRDMGLASRQLSQGDIDAILFGVIS